MPLKAHRRPSGIYRIRGTHHGVEVDRSAHTRKKAQADQIAEAWEREIFDRVILGKRPSETFAGLAVDYMKAGRTLGPRDEDILLALGDKPAWDVTPADCDMIAAKIYPTAAPSTINRNIIAPVSAMMNWAAAADRAPLRKWPRRRERQTMTDWRRPAEIGKILGALSSPEARALAALYVGGGLRASEGVFVDGREFSPDLSRVTVLGTVRPDDEAANLKGYKGTKGFRTRTVMLPPAAQRFLRPVISLKPGRALANSHGEPWADRHALTSTLKRACERADVPTLTPHALRHSWATWDYAVHKDILALQQRGGWTSSDLVERYTHLADDRLKEEVIAAGWAISGQWDLEQTEKRWKNNA